MLSHFLVVSAFVGLVSTTPNSKYRAACQAVEAAISTASDVYYPGKHRSPSRRRDEFMHGQATPTMTLENTIMLHPVSRTPCAWSNLVLQRT